MISIKPLSQNVSFTIRFNLYPDSKITRESDLQKPKQVSPKAFADAEIAISIKPHPSNGWFSIRDNLDSDSNATKQRDLTSEKNLSLRISIDDGRTPSTKSA
jgi:hypothetical protein